MQVWFNWAHPWLPQLLDGPVRLSTSCWSIWPTFSGKVIAPSRAFTRAWIGLWASSHGGLVGLAEAAPMKAASAPATKAPTAMMNTAFLLLRIGPLAGGVDMARPPWVGVNRGRCPQSPKSCGPASKNTSQWPLTRQGKRTWTGVAVAADLATISLTSLP